jgi:membrane protease YdiL (CAAX protease family)
MELGNKRKISYLMLYMVGLILSMAGLLQDKSFMIVVGLGMLIIAWLWKRQGMPLSLTNIKESLGVNFKAWIGLSCLGMIAYAAMLPVVLELFYGQALDITLGTLPVLLPTLLVGGLQASVFVYIGLRLSKVVGLEAAPVFMGRKRLKDIYRPAVIIGFIVGWIVLILRWLLPPLVIPEQNLEILHPLVRGLLKSVYGGIFEELLLRVLAISLLAFLMVGISRILRKKEDWIAGDKVIWASIVMAAILFGLGHLPGASKLIEITPYVILWTTLLNGILGVAFGWLFWRKGIEAAILAHFTTDVVVHILYPLLIAA